MGATNDDDELGELTPEEEQRFGAFLRKHQEAERAKAERRKEPKDFGEFLDRLAPAVVDEMERRITERRKEADAAAAGADDKPSRFGSGFRAFWEGNRGDA